MKFYRVLIAALVWFLGLGARQPLLRVPWTAWVSSRRSALALAERPGPCDLVALRTVVKAVIFDGIVQMQYHAK